jgi:hypothetical protein
VNSRRRAASPMTVPVVAPPGIGSESCGNAGVLASSSVPTAS